MRTRARLHRVIIVALCVLCLERAWAATTVFSDTCTVAGANVDLVSHTPDVGTSWAEVLDTMTATIQCVDATDLISINGAAVNTHIVYQATPSPAIGSQDYDVQVEYEAAASTSDDPFLLIFGYTDTDDYCGLAVYEATANPDAVLFKVVAGTITASLGGGTAQADTGPAVNDVFKVQARGAALTVQKNGGDIISGISDGDCDNAAGVGLGFGNARVAGDDGSAGLRVDNFLVTDQTAAAGGGTIGRLLTGVGWR